MTDNPTLDISRKAHAEALMRDELLVEGFAKLKADYIQGWQQTNYKDQDGRECLWLAVQVIGKVQAHLQSVIANGRLAEAEINDLRNAGRVAA